MTSCSLPCSGILGGPQPRGLFFVDITYLESMTFPDFQRQMELCQSYFTKMSLKAYIQKIWALYYPGCWYHLLGIHDFSWFSETNGMVPELFYKNVPESLHTENLSTLLPRLLISSTWNPWFFLIFRGKLNSTRVILQKCPWKPTYRKFGHSTT